MLTMTDARANMDTGASTPLPRYQCHKKVWALKIKSFEVRRRATIEELDKILNQDKPTPDSEMFGGVIVPEDTGFSAFPVSEEYVRKHNPQAGGYWVQYEDGYQSFSPAAAFESGYTLISKENT